MDEIKAPVAAALRSGRSLKDRAQEHDPTRLLSTSSPVPLPALRSYDAIEVIIEFAGCMTNAFFGPRLRATSTRMRSIISAAEHAPFGRKTSAEQARSKALTVPETIIAGRQG